MTIPLTIDTGARYAVHRALAERPAAHSLPGGCYTDPDVLALEFETVWHREWVFAGHECELAEPGSYLTLTVGEHPLVVIRGHDGGLHALHNVCRHRGSLLCDAERGSARRRLVCPYHQWSYEFDGRLAKARAMAEGFDLAAHALGRAHATSVGGLVFVCVADEPPDFAPVRQVVEPYLDVSFAKVTYTYQHIDVDRMAKKARGLQFVDGSPTIWALRQVKSAAEIDRIRVACTIASDAYDEVTSMTKAGDTTRQAELALRTMLMQKGADHVPFIATAAGQGGYDQIIAGPGEHKLRKGDVLFHDIGCTYDGYFCDFDRNFAVGKISDDAKRIHEVLWLATEAGMKAARPGRTMQDVFHVMAKFLEDAGSIGNNVGRIGHGLGMHLTEPPSFMLGNETPIVPGMVLTIEPGMEYAPGKMLVHEENIAIGESRNELLTRRAPREMPVIG